MGVAALLLAALVVFGCGKGEEAARQPLQAIIVLPEQDRSIDTGEAVYFEGNALGGKPPYAFRWNFGVGIPPSTEREPGNIRFSFEGSYKVELTVTDGKKDIASEYVIVDVTRNDLTSG